MILVVAATNDELQGAGGCPTAVCGVGPVEAAARTALALAETRPDAVLHVGIAGARSFAEPELVLGEEAVYCDADDERWIELRVRPDARLLAAARRALPTARLAPIGTTARVGGSRTRATRGRATGCEVEAMEGYAVLRACALAEVPALEVRALANEIDEPDRARWRVAEARTALAATLPALLEELAHAYA